MTAAEFMRFLFQWQHVSPGSRLHGEAGLLDIIAQLAGFEAAASAWEPHLLRTRLAKYEPEMAGPALFERGSQLGQAVSSSTACARWRS